VLGAGGLLVTLPHVAWLGVNSLAMDVESPGAAMASRRPPLFLK
jgi:hypothetical protein